MSVLDLKTTSGLDLKLDKSQNKLLLGKDLTQPEAAVRRIDEMKEVLMGAAINSPTDLYYMYRDVHRLLDADLLKDNALRYDLTVIRPDRLGDELMKTAGHYHPGSFGELYEVVLGECFCMLQRHNPSDYRIIEEVIVVKAKAGQKIVIPPGFGHILVNPGPEYLVTSNWVSSKFSSRYELYKQAKGAAYFVIEKSGKIEFITNKYFSELPKIQFALPEAIIEKFGLRQGNPIYPIIRENAKKLDFLNRPLDFSYTDVFKEASF
jgi:glucose-6-phosphate isomerase